MLIILFTAMVLSVELILALCALLSHLPFNVDSTFVHSIVWHYQRSFQPQRNLLIYFSWLGIATGMYVFLLWLLKFSKIKPKWDLKPFLMVHALIVCLMVHAGFAVVAMGDPVWAWPVFWATFILGVLISIFWPEFLTAIAHLGRYQGWLKKRPWVGAGLGCVFIFLVIYMPDLQDVVAMMYMGDYFHNWDASLFGGVYAITQGAIPCIDVNITYGLGASVMLAKLLHLMGGFDYTRIVGIAMWVGIIYFIAWFLLLRRFLASTLLAFAAIACALRMHMFTSMTDPFIWVQIVDSVFRYCFDIGVFWMLWMHIQTRRLIYLGIAAFFVSLGIFHMLQTGIYIFVVFVLYTFASALVPCLGGSRDIRVWRDHALVIGSVFAWTALWFYMSVGTHIFEGSFYQNLAGYSSYFIKGAFEGPLSTPLSGNNPVSSIGGLLYPLFCLASFLYVAGEVMVGKARGRDVFAGLIALYALEGHSYYMLMVTEWYTMGITGLFLLFYWITKGLEKAPAFWRRRIAWVLVVLSLYCLVTNRWFTGYPNLLSLSRNPVVDSRTSYRVGPKLVPYFHQLYADFPDSFKLPVNSLGEKDEQLKFEKDFTDDSALKSYYQEQTAWPEDTAMIRRLTPDGGKAAVLSSFEILLLQKADRKPFFYYFPLINSRPLTARNFMVTCLFAYPQLQRTLDQLEAQKPEYIFMERIFLTPQVPQNYFYEYDDLITLLRYVLSKYEPVEIGKYLVAMKRK